MIQAGDVDPSDAWPDGHDCEENEALPERFDGRGMVGGLTVSAEGRCDGQPQTNGSSRNSERDPLSCAVRMRMADVAGAFSTLADGVLVILLPDPAADVPHHPRYRADDRPGSHGPQSRAERSGDRQPVGQGARRPRHARRRSQEDRRPQAPRCRRYRWTLVHGQPDDSRCRGQHGRPSPSRGHPQALAPTNTLPLT